MRFIAPMFRPAFLCILALHAESSAAEPTQPLIVAHRGLLHHAPENTLANFRACLELRLGFEFDVQRTRDGHLVCIHDDTVDRTTNGTGRVAEMTLEQIRQLDAGGWFDPQFAGEQVPTIDEVLQLVAAYRHLNILVAVDLKAAGVEREVARIAGQYETLDRLLFIGRTISEPDVRDQIRRVSMNAHTAAVANDPDEFAAALAAANADWVYVRYLPSQEEADAVDEAGKQMFIAGVTVSGNLPDNWRYAEEVGGDGILTDFPLELRAGYKRNTAGD